MLACSGTAACHCAPACVHSDALLLCPVETHPLRCNPCAGTLRCTPRCPTSSPAPTTCSSSCGTGTRWAVFFGNVVCRYGWRTGHGSIGIRTLEVCLAMWALRLPSEQGGQHATSTALFGSRRAANHRQLALCSACLPRKSLLCSLQGWACTQIFEGHSHYVMQVRQRGRVCLWCLGATAHAGGPGVHAGRLPAWEA